MQLPALPERELFANLVRREIRGRYKGSWLGVVWTLVTPLVMMGAYVLVFTVVFQGARGIPHYWLFVLTGLAVWVFFGGALTVSAGSLIANSGLVKKVRFPRVMVPIASVASQALTMAIMIALIVPFSLWLMPGDRRAMLLAPVVLLLIAMMIVGISLAISVLNVYFRDVEYIVGALLVPWFFITPILYTFDSLPSGQHHPGAVTALKLVNFVTPFVLSLQDTLYWGRFPPLSHWVYIAGAGPIFLAGGYLIFSRMQRDLAVEL